MTLLQTVLLIIFSTCFAIGANSDPEENRPTPAIEKLLAQLKLDAKFRNGADGQLYLDVGISNTSDQVIEVETLSFKRAGIDLLLKGADEKAWPRLVSLVLQQPDVLEATLDKVPVNLSQLAVLQLPPRSSLRLTFDWNKLLISMKPEVAKFGKYQPDWAKSIIKAKISFNELVDIRQASGKRQHGGIASPWLEFDM